MNVFHKKPNTQCSVFLFVLQWQDEIGFTVDVYSQLLKLIVFMICHHVQNMLHKKYWRVRVVWRISRFEVTGEQLGVTPKRSLTGVLPSARSLESVGIYCPQVEGERMTPQPTGFSCMTTTEHHSLHERPRHAFIRNHATEKTISYRKKRAHAFIHHSVFYLFLFNRCISVVFDFSVSWILFLIKGWY